MRKEDGKWRTSEKRGHEMGVSNEIQLRGRSDLGSDNVVDSKGRKLGFEDRKLDEGPT